MKKPRKLTDEHKAKTSATMTGRTLSAAHKQKIADAAKERRRKSFTLAHRKKISESLKRYHALKLWETVIDTVYSQKTNEA